MSIHRVIYRDKPKEAIFRTLVQNFFNNNPDCEIATISITKGEPKRSDAQSRIYHAWVDILRKEFGESKQDCKENLAFEFLGDKDKSTKDLTVPEFDQFLKDIDRYFSVEWSMKLPRDEDFPKTMIKDEHKT